MIENQTYDKKSLRFFTNNPKWDDLVKDCIAFANASGGRLEIGIEDKENEPPKDQRIPEPLWREFHDNISQRTINVHLIGEVTPHSNGGETLRITIPRTTHGFASTTKGQYAIRIGDKSKWLLPDELSRLMSDKPAFAWELQTIYQIKADQYDPIKFGIFLNDIQKSDRVTPFVKQKSVTELLDHYHFVQNGYLTNLGILWIGTRAQRAALTYAPTVHFIKYDENEQKSHKIIWNDFDLNPKELIQRILEDIPDWKEGSEVPDGMFRKFIPHYEAVVLRELLINAFVHRPYTTRGDIFINLFLDRLEIHNPGLLPIGVTESNILHQSVIRNPHLAKVFQDLKLMEQEGSGYDKIYESLLSTGKALPEVHEGNDRVSVTVRKHILKPHVINFIAKVVGQLPIHTKEVIGLSLIAQHTSLSALQFSRLLELPEVANVIRSWIGRLLDWEIVLSKGRTRATHYYINPKFLKETDFEGIVNLKLIEPIRLRELIRETLQTYQPCSIPEIHKRIGEEVSIRQIQHQIDVLLNSGVILKEGDKRWTKYSMNEKLPLQVQ